MRRSRRESKNTAKPSSASGGSNTKPWRSERTTNAIERQFKRRIKTQTVLPSADTAAMLFWVLLASGQISMRKVDGRQNQSISQLNSQLNTI
jgi:putative transposase